ncbi:hypothetical protein [Labrenzia sp. CE80]|uniref:hypothetical protein n=1 Tax=Labrenzia sp. CE80 TaxID=1788986 RepID=UPI00129B04B5|nr:hypothetical protein [Labrenzia sp. CE80]
MSNKYHFTKKQLRFLDLFKMAADFDCLPLLDYYCMDLFDHDRISRLTEDQLVDLAECAQKDIFGEALEKGYRPASFQFEGDRNGLLC